VLKPPPRSNALAEQHWHFWILKLGFICWICGVFVTEKAKFHRVYSETHDSQLNGVESAEHSTNQSLLLLVTLELVSLGLVRGTTNIGFALGARLCAGAL
jgi:hypothetical protein